MFSFGTRRASDSDLSLTITIGSARVTATLGGLSVIPGHGDHFSIYYTTSVPLVYQEQLDTERFNRSMIAALMEAIQNVQGDGLKHIQTMSDVPQRIGSVRCVFSAPWFVSQTRVICLKRKKPFMVKDQLIHSLVADEVTLFKEALLKQNSPYSLVTKKNRIIDTHIIRSLVNGYPTNEPLDKTGLELALTVYISAVSEAVCNRIIDVVTRSLHIEEEDIDFVTSTLISYLAVGDFIKTSSQYLLIEITGEVTDIAFVENGVLTESISFPVGTNSIVRSVQKKSKSTPDDVQAKLALLLKAKAERASESISMFERSVYTAVHEWREALYRSLERAASGRPVPQTALLLVDSTWERLYLTALKDQPSELFTFSDRPFTVFSMQAPALVAHTTVTAGAQLYPLAVLTALMHRALLAR